MTTKLLEIESALYDLMRELEHIRSASAQIEQAAFITNQVVGSAEAVTSLVADITRRTQVLADEIHAAQLPENVKAIKEESDRIIGRLHDVLSGLTLLDQRQGVVIDDTRKTQEIVRESAGRLQEHTGSLQELASNITALANGIEQSQSERQEQLVELINSISVGQGKIEVEVQNIKRESKIQRWILIVIALIAVSSSVINWLL